MKTKLYFLKLLSSYINGEIIEYEDEIDWSMIEKLSKIHSVQVMVYIMLSKMDRKPSIIEHMKNNFLHAVQVATVQKKYMDEVILELTKNHIDHLLVKGYVLKDYYPDMEARSYGDVDIMVEDAEMKDADIILRNMGFTYDKEHYLTNVWSYRKGVLYIEMHNAIIHDKLFLGVDYVSYFKEKVENKILIDGSTYKLTNENHFIYLMVHLAKHFFNAGAGIRMFIDIAIYLKKFRNELNFDYIENEFEKIKLNEFVNVVYLVCNRYFNIDIEHTDIENEDIIINYILDHGVFGYDNNNIWDLIYRKSDNNKVKILIDRVFPKYETMVLRNDWFKNCSRLLLPYGWIRRWLEFIFIKKKRNMIGKKISTISNSNGDAEKHNTVIKQIGLKKDKME